VDAEVSFCRLTQLGLLRLLTTSAVMGEDCLSVKAAWAVYDRWWRDPRVSFRWEPVELDALFRQATIPVSRTPAPKALGDCYLLALSQAAGASLVTFDGALASLADKTHHKVILLG
jgi:hypothetical protein